MFKKLIEWSENTYSDLPWRKNRTLYRTLVSEIMLQQTTVTTVCGKFELFLEEFPTLAALGCSTEEEITIAWKGLGYYRRARNLRAACLYIEEELEGVIPLELLDLQKIPGIGEYTAHAMRAIGANLESLAIDANIERVLSRIYGLKEEKGIKLQKEIRRKYSQDESLKYWGEKKARSFNEALMDLGRVYCQSRKVLCEICPVRSDCYSFHEDIDPISLPLVKVKNKKIVKLELSLLRFFVKKEGKILGEKRKKGRWLEGQIELPSYILSCEDPQFNQYPQLPVENYKVEDLPMVKTTITKYNIKNYLCVLSEAEFFNLVGKGSESFYFYGVAEEKNFSTATLKLISKNNKLT